MEYQPIPGYIHIFINILEDIKLLLKVRDSLISTCFITDTKIFYTSHCIDVVRTC